MPNKKTKGLYDELCKDVINKKDEIISVSELWSLYHKYIEYQNSKEVRNIIYGDRKILYFLLEKLFVTKCADLDLISVVFKRFYTEENCFRSIILDLFTESNYFETDEIIKLLKYCLKYAYKKKMLFDGMRMAMLSHFFQLLLPNSYYTPYLPKIIKILQQYGMLLNPINGQAPSLDHEVFFSIPEGRLFNIEQEFNFNCFALWNSIIMEGVIFQNPKFIPVNELSGNSNQVLNISVEIAKLFLRDSGQFKLSHFYFIMAKKEVLKETVANQDLDEIFFNIERKMLEFNPVDAINFIQEMGLFLPELPSRCLKPISMKHCCKQLIRKLLHLNWQLPNGIFKLDLPKSLLQYLNLEVD